MKRRLNKIYKFIKKGKFNPRVIDKKNTRHLIVNGDCEDVAKYIPNDSIDLIITDPPYNQGLDYGKNFNDRKPWSDYYSWLKNKLSFIPRILSLEGTLYLISYPEINARLLPFLEDELGLKLQRWITWHYPTNIGHSYKNFTRSQRSILFLTKSKKYIFNRNKILQPYKNEDVAKIKDRIKKKYKGRGAYDLLNLLSLIEMRLVENSKKPSDIFNINLLKNVSKDRLNEKHPCQLPFELISRLIKVSSKKGDIVLDPFAGTLSTSLIATRLERNSIGIEKNPKYIELALKRFKQ